MLPILAPWVAFRVNHQFVGEKLASPYNVNFFNFWRCRASSGPSSLQLYFHAHLLLFPQDKFLEVKLLSQRKYLFLWRQIAFRKGCATLHFLWSSKGTFIFPHSNQYRVLLLLYL